MSVDQWKLSRLGKGSTAVTHCHYGTVCIHDRCTVRMMITDVTMDGFLFGFKEGRGQGFRKHVPVPSRVAPILFP